jgi:hypothetical protein
VIGSHAKGWMLTPKGLKFARTNAGRGGTAGDDQQLPDSRNRLASAGRLVAGTACDATPGDRTERFHGDRNQARRGASLASRRRIGSIEKAPLPGLFP